MKFFLPFLFVIILTWPLPIYARTTPQDIYNAQVDEYNARVKNYTPEDKKKLEDFKQKISDLNKQITTNLETNMVRQGEILDEYIYRHNIEEPHENGIARNLSNPVENARYWLTYAHEAVAYQAAKHYVFSLTSENNINGSINSQLGSLQSDINVLIGKVNKSQKIIADLVK